MIMPQKRQAKKLPVTKSETPVKGEVTKFKQLPFKHNEDKIGHAVGLDMQTIAMNKAFVIKIGTEKTKTSEKIEKLENEMLKDPALLRMVAFQYMALLTK